MTGLITKFNYTNQFQITEELTDVIDVSVDLGSEIKNNKMIVKVKNSSINILSDGTIQYNWVDNAGIAKFKVVRVTAGQVIDEELIDIYATYTNTDPTLEVQSNDFLLMTGIISKGQVPFKEKEHSVILTGLDRSAVILNKLTVAQSYKVSDALNCPKIVQRLLQNGVENSRSNSFGFDFDGNKALGNPFLVDARLFSDGIVDSGTVTSVSSRKLIETGQNFSTTVDKDDLVRNTTSNETAFVISIDSDTTLTLSKDIFTSTDSYQISDGFIQDFRPNGTVFPDISFSRIDKPLNESIGELSQIDKTNTSVETNTTTGTLIVKRGIRWFIDKQNRFHWYVPGNTPEYIMQVGQTSAISPDTVSHKIINTNLNNEVRTNVNFIIYNAGTDVTNNNAIRSFTRAQFSGTPIVKDSFRPWVHIAKNMKGEAERADELTKNTDGTYRISGTFPLTPAWDSTGTEIANSAGTATTYNNTFISEAKIRGNAQSQKEFQKSANPRWSGQVSIRGEPVLVGDLIQFTSKPHGMKNIKLRTIQVTHSITPISGWITTLRVEEDELEQTVGL